MWTASEMMTVARDRGYPVTRRLITDWVSIGLLDKAKRRPKGRGSTSGVWSENQANLFWTLLEKRRNQSQVAALANVPIYFWLNWGDEYVPQRQLRRAMRTWAKGACRTSESVIRDLILPPLAESFGITKMTGAARTEFVEAVRQVTADGQLDFGSTRPTLEAAARRLHAPNGTHLPAIETYLDSLETRLLGLAVFRTAPDEQRVSGDVLNKARAVYQQLRPSYEQGSGLSRAQLNSQHVNGAGASVALLVGLALPDRTGASSPGAAGVPR
jgi:hypothetical protein